MTLVEFLTQLTRWLLLALAVVTVADYVRFRGRARLDVALVFVSLGGSTAITIVKSLTGFEARWLTLIGTLLVVAHPYLLLRLVEHFRRVPGWVRWSFLAGMLVSLALVVIYPAPLPRAATVIVVIYFALVEGYAAGAFVRGAFKGYGVTRWRLRMAAGGAGLLALAIAVAGVVVAVPSLQPMSALWVQALAIVAVLCFFLAFTPPRRLGQAIQMLEVRDFLHDMGGRPPAERAALAIDDLRRAGERVTGGQWIAVARWDESRQRLVVPAGEGGDTDLEGDLPATDGVIGEAWKNRGPRVALRPSEFGTDGARLAAKTGAGVIFAVPMAAGERVHGLLIVLRQGQLLFPADDLQLLGLLAEQTALALDYDALLKSQSSLIKRLQVSTDQLEAANRELEAFAYSVSHDLRAPLRAIDGFSQMLLEDYLEKLDAPGQDALHRVRSGAQRMANLIDDLLNLSRIARVEMQRGPIDLSALARGIAEDLRRVNPERALEFNIADGVRVQADPALMRVVLENLLGNAVKFTAGRSPGRIELGRMRRDGRDAVFVRDNGAGFDMAFADKLFGAFQRLHSVQEFPGTGIGLATVQRIINRHGGRAWAEGTVGQGATFFFEL